MNKQETLVVVALFALLMGWMWNQNRLARDRLLDRPPEAPVQAPVDVAPAVAPTPEALPPTETPPSPEPVQPPAPVVTGLPEVRVTNRVDDVEMVFSSKGGVLHSVTLHDPQFRRELDPDSGPTRFVFDEAPAFLLEGIPGISRQSDFELYALPAGTGVDMRVRTDQGLEVERRFRIAPDYRVSVSDRFVHRGEQPLSISTNRIFLGAMAPGGSKTDALGVDTLPLREGRSKVRHWETRDLPALFGAAGGGCARRPAVTAHTPLRVSGEDPRPQRWVALKNRFFVQLMRSETPNVGVDVHARRDVAKADLSIDRVHAALRFPPMTFARGDSLEREVHAYVGPKRLSLLRRLGHGEDGVMQFGIFAWLCRWLLPTLNALYWVIPNYGVAIILLTILVRILFWPVTHRSTESMKRLQELQPQIKAIQQEFKDNPQQMQQETWKFYKEHKVNPMASCLPMLVQIPVFIALFTVLRSAVELRFAPFLWVRDLSEPEGLLAGVLPIPLNILPLLMSATMAWQQHLTPTAGDPQQRKMMMFMPVMMLFFFYTMPSALVLYWTTSQLMAIGQMLIQRKRKALKDAAANGGTDAGAQPAMLTRQMRRQLQRSGPSK